MKDNTREDLARVLLKRRNGWLRFLLSQCVIHPDGSLTIPPSVVTLHKRHLTTPYLQLPERDKDYLRSDADAVLVFLAQRDEPS